MKKALSTEELEEMGERMLQMVEEHSGHEETVLQMMKRGLRAPRED